MTANNNHIPEPVNFVDSLRKWRDWFPVPHPSGRVGIVRWILLEGNRNAIAGALLTFVFASFMGIGLLWTVEMAELLTETPAVQTILNTLLGGIILLVSIVVSINSIVLSHDITSVETQEARIKGVLQFREEIGRLTDSGESPSDPATFLKLMSDLISVRADRLETAADGLNEDFATEIQQYVDQITETVGIVDENLPENVSSAEFGVLWLGLELDYGQYMDRSRNLQATYDSNLSEDVKEHLDDLVEAFQLFATGREYFKTLYYGQEVSELSRTLLIVSLPAILINAWAILAINAALLPDFWFLGLPPILTFVTVVFTISLSPYILLTSYMLRLATVAKRTTAAGPFSLKG